MFGSVSPMGVALSLRNVWLSFPRGRRHVVQVLADVSLQVRAGEVVAALGQRAQGKTSLLRVAAGMERPDRGQVVLDGRDPWQGGDGESERRRWGGAALVDRLREDLDVTVLRSITLPLLGAHGGEGARERAVDALASVGASACAQRREVDLSDRERALVRLAQAIARGPRVLLVDDLTATLGLGDIEDVTRVLCMLAREREIAVLMATSDAQATRWSDRVATLTGGQLLLPDAPSGGDAREAIDTSSV